MDALLVSCKGVSPLLMNSDRFCNPLDPATKVHKELTSKRKKTDEDHIIIARSSWLGACYYDEVIGYYVPGVAVERTIHEAAKLQKMGKQVQRGLVVSEERVSIEFDDNTLPPEQLWEKPEYRDCRSVRVQQAKVMRYRPVFRDWGVKFTVLYSPEMLNKSDISKFVEDAGAFIGFLDYRPRFGRFVATIKEITKHVQEKVSVYA